MCYDAYCSRIKNSYRLSDSYFTLKKNMKCDQREVSTKGNRYRENLLWFIFAINTVLHGKHAFTLNYLYDTDDVLYFRESTLNWLEIGRQGRYLQKNIWAAVV